MCFLLHSLRNGGCTRGPHPGRSSPPGLGIRTGPGKLEANRKRASLLSPGVCAFLRKGPAGETARIAGDRLGWDRWGPRTGEGPGKTRSLFPKTPKIPVCPFPRKKNPLGTQPRPHPGGLQGAPIPPTDSPLPPPRQVHGQVDRRARLKRWNHPSKLETCRSPPAAVLLVKVLFFASALSQAWESCLCPH